MSEQLLQVKNLVVNVEDTEILHGIDLEINRGETHVLMGPNGAGKSTLGYALMGSPRYQLTNGEESGELEFCHNPFSMPQGGVEALENQDPLEILAYQYDLVCNGIELSSGAVRNHDPEIMVKAFELVGLGEEDVKAKFPAMYNAFCYGAPPHAGIAPGVDRMVMLIAGEDSIREIIPFPMNKNAQDVMMGAPAEVDEKQLREVHIKISAPEKQ